jgi:ATP-dependent Clp protease ATP-binding subunit ClpA
MGLCQPLGGIGRKNFLIFLVWNFIFSTKHFGNVRLRNKMSFLTWYFNQGLRGYFRIWNNFLWFSLHILSTKRLFQTLFSPWKRSVLPKDWEGFHPLKAFARLMAEAYFRFFGGLVRLVLVFFGLLFFLFVFILGLFFLAVWILFPLLFFGSLAGLLFQPIPFLSALFIILIFGIAVYFSFKNDHRQEYIKMNLMELSKQDFFYRILQRVGLPVDISSKEVFGKLAGLDEYLPSIGLNREEFQKIISWEIEHQRKIENYRRFWTREFLQKIPPLFRYLNYGYTFNLNKYAQEISRYNLSESSDFDLINYEREMELMINALTRKDQNCVLLYGSPGVGRSSIVNYLTKMIREQKAGYFLNYRRIMQINLLEVLAERNQEDEAADNFLHTIFKEAAFAGNIILVMNNFENYFDDGNTLAKNIASIMQEYLFWPSFSFVATADTVIFHDKIEPHRSFIKNLETIEVKEPEENDAIEMLFKRYGELDEKGKLMSYQTIREIVKRSDDLGKITPLPGRAVSLFEKVLRFWKSHPEKELNPELVNDYIELKTGVPQGDISNSEKKQLLNLEEHLHKRIIGQDEAIQKVAQSIRQARTLVGDDKKPVGAFLFIGPTGVGKTETAKALAETYYKNENNMVRFDMNEFSSADSIINLIGSYENKIQGQLISKVKDNPFSVILLDELEKADKQIHDIFLQALDEGYLLDAFGDKVSLKGNIIIATSNAGSEIIKMMIEEKEEPDKIKEQLVDYLIDKGIFKTEFINRFDAVVFFKPFSDKQLRDVVKLMLSNFSKKLKTEQNIQVDYEEAVVEKIIQQGYDPVFGARSVKRYLNDKIKNIVADKLLVNTEKIDRIFISSDDVR